MAENAEFIGESLNNTVRYIIKFEFKKCVQHKQWFNVTVVGTEIDKIRDND